MSGQHSRSPLLLEDTGRAEDVGEDSPGSLSIESAENIVADDNGREGIDGSGQRLFTEDVSDKHKPRGAI